MMMMMMMMMMLMMLMMLTYANEILDWPSEFNHGVA
jgi:hypothetical protein